MRFDDFAGQVLYGDEWRGQDFRGRRVAVLATGRDAARVLPGVARSASSVKVFLEDADWVLPALPKPVGGLLRAGTRLPVVGSRARRAMARAHLRLSVKDPWMRRQLTPDDRFGDHAATSSRGFYRALQGEHCKLIRWPVYAVTEHGVRSVEGIEHRVDVIVVPAPGRLARPIRRKAPPSRQREELTA
jgi:cation diffusion facilitator CzcD-associated flavoprotein CzcO